MTRVTREFENLLLAVRSSVAMQRPASCALMDNLIEKTKKCFADQKSIQYWSIAFQIFLPALGLAAPFGTAALASATSVDWVKKFSDKLAKSDASTLLQWSSKLGDLVKARNDAKGFDYQASQKQIDATTTELTGVNQAQATFLQSLETAMQRHQQILDNAKR